MSSFMAKRFYRNILSTRLINHKVLFFQQPKCALRKSSHHLFQLSLMRSYTNSTFPLPSQEESASPKKDAKKLLAVGVIGVATFIFTRYYWNSYNEKLPIKTVERGTRPKTYVSDDELVSRPEVMRELMKILQPSEHQIFYYFIYGEHGIGKSTLIRLASNKAGEQQDNEKSEQGGKGIIYVDIPADPEGFGKAFGKAINSFIGPNIEPIPEWERALNTFKHASAVYKEKHGKPPVIIYDNIDNISQLDPKILDYLQSDAHDNSYNHSYISVFISNKFSTINHMKNRRVWRHVEYPVIEIGDLSEEESINYLVNKCKIKKEEAKKFYELVGGNMRDLKSVAHKSLAGKCFEDIRQEVWIEVKKRLNSAKLLENQLHHKVGKHIIRDLLNSNQGIDYWKFKRLFKNSDEDVAKVLESDVFSYHPSNHTVTFQSRSVESFIQEYSEKIFGFKV